MSHRDLAALLRSALAVALAMGLSGCFSVQSVKREGADRSIAVVVLKNPDARPPDFISYQPVTFDNHGDMDGWVRLNGSKVVSPFNKSADVRTLCFKGNICVLFNLVQGRYHMDSFGYRAGNNVTIYNLSAAMEKEASVSGSLLALATGGKAPETIYNANDWYFLVPAGGPTFLGSYRWSDNPQGFLASMFSSGSFGFERDKNGLDERAALIQLLNDADFRALCAEWMPMIQRRISKLSQPLAAPLTPAAPAPEKPRRSKKK